MRFLCNKSLAFLGYVLLYFAIVRYYGFYEDAGRYLLQVVNYLHPERFTDDVPFMFGNQDSYTLFSPFMALVFKVFGVNCGAFGAVFAFQMSWCLGLICLVNRWCSRFACTSWSLPVFAICVTTLAFKLYGCGSYFPIIDGILVARFVAEIFMLFAFGCFFCKSKWVSFALFVAATTVHPLMAGWGLPLWLFYFYPKTKRPILLGVLLFPLTAFLHIGRLDFLPPDWLDRPIFFSPKGSDVIFHVVLLAFWFAMGRMVKNTQISQFAKCVFCVCLSGLFLQYVGIFMEHVFLIQAQPYRVQWFSIVLSFPVFAVFLHEQFVEPRLPQALRGIKINPKFAKAVFALGLFVLSACAFACNYIQLTLEQGGTGIDYVVAFIDLPDKLVVVQQIVLAILLVLSLVERRFVYALIFGYSLLNAFVTLLPIFAIVFYLTPNLSRPLKAVLVALATVMTLAEILSVLPGSPMQGNALWNVVFLGMVFVWMLWFMYVKDCESCRKKLLPLVLTIISFAVWDACNWDARSEEMRNDERQMDAFFNTPVFPQVSDRGKMLFVEGGETPLQSRFKFLTGTYADETINVGEIFYQGQFREARRRKNALLNGDTVLRDMSDYGRRIQALYRDKDALAGRVEYLCQSGEITRFATDYDNMPFARLDSVFLDVKKKYAYLYGCSAR
jgi:hypothetical protein